MVRMPINKSQGQFIKYCGMDLRSLCFSHGQLAMLLAQGWVDPRVYLFLLLEVKRKMRFINYYQVLHYSDTEHNCTFLKGFSLNIYILYIYMHNK